MTSNRLVQCQRRRLLGQQYCAYANAAEGTFMCCSSSSVSSAVKRKACVLSCRRVSSRKDIIDAYTDLEQEVREVHNQEKHSRAAGNEEQSTFGVGGEICAVDDRMCNRVHQCRSINVAGVHVRAVVRGGDDKGCV